MKKDWPTQVQLSHDSGLQSFKLPLQWNKKRGTAVVKWTIPAGAKMGRWTMNLLKGEKMALYTSVGDFSIESFRVPLIQMRLTTSTPVFVLEKNIPVQVSATFFSGGPAANLPDENTLEC